MAKKILNVVEQAYRATLEEQDDPALWLTAVLKGTGGDVAVLLQGAAVNYLVQAQDASGLAFGDRRQTQPPRLVEDLQRLVKKGVPVLYVADDVRERGLAPAELVAGPAAVARARLPQLLGDYDLVWTW